MQVGGLVIFLALAASPPSGSPKEALGPVAPEKKPAPKTPAEPKRKKKPASPEWLLASGLGVRSERTGPEAAATWARLLAGEKSHAAASRAFENLLRRWPGAPQAESALLAAARQAMAAGQFDRAVKLVAGLRARWPEGRSAPMRDLTEVEIGEARLLAAGRKSFSARKTRSECKAAYRVFAAILKRDRAGPIVERATLGRARALYGMGKIGRAVKTLEVFLREFPASRLAPTARQQLAAYRSTRARGRSTESQVLDEEGRGIGWIYSGPDGKGKDKDKHKGEDEDDAIRRTYEAIAARQAELKIAEARLYLRLKKPRAAEWVLRSVLRRYGDTPSAKEAARMLERLSED
jgi:outer membrane protein assembly factor BamD (BamD/ComL family)